MVAEDSLRIGSYDVCVEVERSLISAGTDRASLAGAQPAVVPRAWVVGRIESTGPAAPAIRTDLPVGTRVLCRAEHASRLSLDVLRAVILAVPHSAPAEDLLLAAEATVSAHALDRGRVGPVDRVNVLGLGLVGQLCVRLARGRGATVGVVGHRPGRAALAGSAGGLPLPSVTVVACADPAAIAAALGATADGGRVVVVGVPSVAAPVDVASHVVRRQVDLVGAHVGRLGRDGRAELAQSILKRGWRREEVEGLISNRIPGMDAARAYAIACSQDPGVGAVLEWNHE